MNTAKNTAAARKNARKTAAPVETMTEAQPALIDTAHAPPVTPETSGNGVAAHVMTAAAEQTASAGGTAIGFLLSWNASKLRDVTRTEARALFAAANLEDLIPADLALETALTRAAGEGKTPKGYESRRGEGKGLEGVFFFYRVTPGVGEQGDNFSAGARVKIENGQIVALAPEGSAADDVALSWAQDVARRAERLTTHIEARDLSTALCRAADKLNAYPVRASGGIYFAHPSSRTRWSALAAGLGAMGFAPITIPMYAADPDSVAAGAATVAGGLESELSSLAEDMEKAERGMRGDALERRVKMTEDLLSRALMFRDILADAAAGIEKRAADIQAAFQVALDREREESSKRTAASVPTPGTHHANMAEAGRKAFRTRMINAARRGDRAAIDWCQKNAPSEAPDASPAAASAA